MTKRSDKDKDQHLTNLRATLPAALEDVSDTAWQEFHALHASQQRQFEPTQPLTNAAPLTPRPKPAPVAANKSVTLDHAMQLARRSNRVCPMPDAWKGLFDTMQAAAPANSLPPVVIDGAAWKAVPPMQKRLRLREQLEWAQRYGVLEAACRFLESLPEEAWLHF